MAQCTERVHGFAVGHFGDDAGAEIEAEVVAEIDADADADADAVAVAAAVIAIAVAVETETAADGDADAGVDALAWAETCRTGVRTDRTASPSNHNSMWPIAAWYHVQAPKSLAWALSLSHSIPRLTEYRLI